MAKLAGLKLCFRVVFDDFQNSLFCFVGVSSLVLSGVLSELKTAGFKQFLYNGQILSLKQTFCTFFTCEVSKYE